MKCLFIGGPKAGMLVDVLHLSNTVQFPVFPDTQATFGSYHCGPIEGLNASFVTYRLDCATDKSGRRHNLYVLDGSGDPLIQLMEFYAGSPHEKS